MRSELVRLTQGSRFVLEYEADMRRLAAFVPNLAIPQYLHFKFEDGLSLSIKKYMTVIPQFTLAEVIDSAHLAEALVHAETRQKESREQKRNKEKSQFAQNSKRGRGSSSHIGRFGSGFPELRRGQYSHEFRQPAPTHPSQYTTQWHPYCRRCNRSHPIGACSVTVTCFHCGKPGHIRSSCPELGLGG